MPDFRPQAITNEFLRRRTSSALPQQMYVQKLTYIAHGWNLAINKRPLTILPPEAWDNGPVYRDVWDHVRDYGYKGQNFTLIDQSTGEPFEASLSASERAIIDHVWKKYSNKSSKQLSDMTHEPGTPWYKAYFRRRNEPLDNEEIRQHYVALALAGRDRRSNISD